MSRSHSFKLLLIFTLAVLGCHSGGEPQQSGTFLTIFRATLLDPVFGNIEAEALSSSEIRLVWQQVENAEGLQWITVKYRKVGEQAYNSSGVTLDPTVTQESIDNLAPETEYEFRLRALKENGDEIESQGVVLSTFQSSSLESELPSPTNFLAEPLNDKITLTWEYDLSPIFASLDDLEGVVFEILRNDTHIADVTLEEENTYVDTVAPCVNYTYEVRLKVPGVGTSPKASVEALSESGSATLTNVSGFAGSGTPGMANLSWIPLANAPDSYYQIKYMPEPLPSSSITVHPDNASYITHPQNMVSTTSSRSKAFAYSGVYYFWIRVVKGNNQCERSEWSEAVMLPIIASTGNGGCEASSSVGAIVAGTPCP